MNNTLKLPMMMYGKFRTTRAKRDKEGNAIVKRIDKKGRKVYEREKTWIVHSRSNGDPGVYPSVNHIYTRISNGRQKLIKPAEDLMNEWATLAKMWAKDNNWICEDKKVVIEMVAHFPNDNRKRDTNNVFKLMMDAFEGILYENDRTALPRVMDYKKVKDGEEPYFELTIYKKENEHEIFKERCQRAS